MNDNTAKDSHYARLRRQFRDSKRTISAAYHPQQPKLALRDGYVRLYGIHTVKAALQNKKRHIFRLLATKNAFPRLDVAESALGFPVEFVSPRSIDALVGTAAVHQGVLLETKPLTPLKLTDLSDKSLILILDQITDPHNVGAIMRSAVAFNAAAIITTIRHSPQESGVLAKSASGALELIELINVRNLAEAMQQIQEMGFNSIGLDSEAPNTLEQGFSNGKIALVLGAEGKGLRQKTRQTVNILARLPLPGQIKSLNVSNAAAIALYAARHHLDR